MIENRLIEQIKNIIKSEKISCADANLFISNSRGILESNNLKLSYPILSFYCDWTLHPNIDRNLFLYKILGEISKGYSTNGQNGEYSVIPHLKVYELLNEILLFLTYICKNEKIIVHNEFSFQSLIMKIFENLILRKIHFPSERSTSTNNKIKLNSISEDKEPIIINSIMIEEVKSNLIKFQMTMDFLTFEIREWKTKEVTINEFLEIKIEYNKFWQLQFSYIDASIKW